MPEEFIDLSELPPGWSELDYLRYRNKVLLSWVVAIAAGNVILVGAVIVMLFI